MAPDGYGITDYGVVDRRRDADDATAPRGQGKTRYRVRVRDLMLAMSIGIYEHEHGVPQRVRVDVDLDLAWPDGGFAADDTRQVYCYEKLIGRIEAIAAAGHIRLCETFAERIADMALESEMVLGVRVTVEKLDVFDHATVGAEVEKGR